MGEFEIRGRDANYKPAALKQYRQFPGLGMSVHDLLSRRTCRTALQRIRAVGAQRHDCGLERHQPVPLGR